MIIYKSRFLTWGEIWFDNPASQISDGPAVTPPDTVSKAEPKPKRVDCLIYFQQSKPIPGARTREMQTYLIDLEPGAQQLHANLKGDTWRKIKRARDQERIVCEVRDARDRTVMDHFERFYNTFAALKGINPMQRNRLEGMSAAGVLDLSVARNPQGEILVYHANYRSSNSASGINSASLFRECSDSAHRNMIGRANCLLTWTDFLRYKEAGVKSYDFGGWHRGDDPILLKVNRFKANFGGQVVRRYQCERILTYKGWLLLRVARFLQRSRLFRPAQNVRTLPAQAQILPAY